MWKFVKRLLMILVIGAVLAMIVLIVRTNPGPWSREEIARLTKGLNEAAAVGVPHGFLLKANERNAHAALLEKVEAGKVLDTAESAEYRAVYQKILFNSQAFLSRFDAQLTVLANHAMEMPNNRQGNGIAGNHDHHDLSGRLNFTGLLASLDALERASTSLGRIRFANAAYKDLVDLISHIGVAPHTVSVAYQPPETPWADAKLGEEFEAMLKAYKKAQFAPVHSPAYWAAVDEGLAAYDSLIDNVQSRIIDKTSPWERRVAGRFLSPQTLAPPVDLERQLRR